MNEVQLLQQLYNGFINQQTPSGFFNGLVDYLDYADSTESFDYYSTLLMEKGKPLRDKLDKAEKKAIIRLDSVRKAIGEYIEKQKIDDTRIKEHLQEYDEIKSRRMTYVGQPHAISLHNALSRVFEVLESIPESKSHISKYLVYVKGTSIAKQFLSLQEVDDFYYAKEEYEAAEKNELWGQVPLLGQIAQVIKDGKKHQLDLRAGKKSFTMNTTDLMALNILVGEWEAVRDGEVPKLLDGSPRKGFMLFDIQKIKPIADRLHNYFLKEDVDYAVTAERFKKKIEDEKNATTTVPAPKSVSKQNKDGSYITRITFIERKSSAGAHYRFYINDDMSDIRQLRSDSSRIRDLVKVIKGESVNFRKDLLDYVNSNSDCAIYCAGKYKPTKILERDGKVFRVRSGMKTEIRSEVAHNKRFNKQSKA